MRAFFLVCSLISLAPPAHSAPPCAPPGLAVQVLGSGGPEARAGRAGSSYLVVIDGVARALIDLGAGALLRFGESGAQLETLDVVALSHLHTDHTADFAPLLKHGQFDRRERPLLVVGPTGGAGFPDLPTFVRATIGPDGAFPYLRGHLAEAGADGRFPVRTRVVDHAARTPVVVVEEPGLRVLAQGVSHGPVPALAFRVEHGDRSIVFGGDNNGDDDAFVRFAGGATVLVAHTAVPEEADRVALNLHARPAEIGAFAARAGVRTLVLSHWMRRSEDAREDVLRHVHAAFAGVVVEAVDHLCVPAGGTKEARTPQ